MKAMAMQRVSAGTAGEWRVYFTFNEIWDDLPVQSARIKQWLAENTSGTEGVDWRLSSYSIHPYVAFLDEEDATLCKIAF